MPCRSVVLLQKDLTLNRVLSVCLSASFQSVQSANTLAEARASIAKHRASVAVIDIEDLPLSEVEAVAREFPGIHIVCTHHVADEAMWAAVLNAGAADLCASSDTPAVLKAADCQLALSDSA